MAYEERSQGGGSREGGRDSKGADGKRSGGNFFRRKKSCPFTGENAPEIDWKNPRMLGRYVSERGKIIPSRITSVCQKKQRELAVAIKNARYMGLMPYVRLDGGGEGKSFGSREPREYREPRGDYKDNKASKES